MSRLLGDGRLAPLMRTARLIEGLQHYLRQQLPAELGKHLFVGGFHQGRLTLITDRAVWLTRLRYEQPRLLELTRQYPGLETVTGFDLKVRPVRPAKAPLRQPRHLPTKAANELSSCANDVDDPGLRDALRRLAAHAENPAENTHEDPDGDAAH